MNPGLVGVSGMPLRVKGTATLQLELSGYKYQIEVIAADLKIEAILGINFLDDNQCAIDLPGEQCPQMEIANPSH